MTADEVMERVADEVEALVEALKKIADDQGWKSSGTGHYTTCTACGNDKAYGCDDDCVYEIARAALTQHGDGA